MRYVNLGRTGLKVSRLCLGCMSFGVEVRDWHLDEEQSRPYIRRALESGINFFDTANMYGRGASEEVLGRALRDFARRDEVVVATKVYFPMRPDDPNGQQMRRVDCPPVLVQVEGHGVRADAQLIQMVRGLPADLLMPTVSRLRPGPPLGALPGEYPPEMRKQPRDRSQRRRAQEIEREP